MTNPVRLSAHAVRDLEEISDHAATTGGPDQAQHFLARIEATIETLSAFPERGHYPDELQELGIRRYREIVFGPYRIVYQITEGVAHVLLVADGRRNMQALLLRRLLDPATPFP